MTIRQAEPRDASRIAEILIFSKRMHYREIFHDDAFSFGVLQVLPQALEYLEKPALLEQIWVYEDDFVKGMIHTEGCEVCELYVDPFFERGGIGSALLRFAVEGFGADRLWVLEDNAQAVGFYQKHGFAPAGAWRWEVEGQVKSVLFKRYKKSSC